MAFGKEIKRIRTASNLTAQHLVDLVGLDLAKYRNWEARDGNPKYEDIQLLVKFFKMPLEEIMRLEKIPAQLMEIKTEFDQSKENIVTNNESYKDSEYTDFSQSDIGREAFTVIKSLSRSNETLSDATKVMADNVRDLVVMVKYYMPINFDAATKKVASPLMVAEDSPEDMAKAGLEMGLWPTMEQGLIDVQRMIALQKKLQKP